MLVFNSSNSAFEHYYNILNSCDDRNGTKYLYNEGFYIQNPLQRYILCDFRRWNKDYAEYEWQWYLSGNKSAKEISKHAKIWKSCMDENGDVNSNYGYQWYRGNQIGYVVEELTKNPNSRRAAISIYDAKNRHNFENDTPCTYSILFYIDNLNRLCMSVQMRSNDLWYGFCNDQYCFSKLQELVANKLNKRIGNYFHFTNNLHIYERHYRENIRS